MQNAVSLEDKYRLERGRIFATGTQALVRLPMLQQERDRASGKRTAGFISGYRGSPLGVFDEQLKRADEHLKAHDIVFHAGVNEDLAAASIWGSQQVGLFPGAHFDGVFGIWYGKGPGVDRSLDAMRHANLAGTSRYGGVLALLGDDPLCVSSTVAQQSDFNMQSLGMPLLYPASVRDYFEFGLTGFALSRFAGLWTGFKCVTESVESSANFDFDPQAIQFVTPDFEFPADGVHIRLRDPFVAQERRLLNVKLPAALAFARANRIDRVAIGSPEARLGIVTAGKTYGDVRQALNDLGFDERLCREIGLSVYKVGLLWPLETEGLKAFAAGLDELLVVEEKRAVLEPQIKEALYHLTPDRRPRVVGKTDETGAPFMASAGGLNPAEVARVIAKRLAHFYTNDRIRNHLAFLDANERQAGAFIAPHVRVPFFCSGCPHNISTKVPEGSRAGGGIGCHTIAMWLDRATDTITHMGGEGAPWIGQAPFTDEKHIFQNLGDGTYFHSGSLAIRAAVASKANITYKILYNDAVAMTGGQAVDGLLSVPIMAAQLAAEGAARIVVVTDEPQKYAPGTFQPAVEIRHRDELDSVQRALRETPGCTVLIYDQTCAAEKRRRRKRKQYPDPDERAFINEAVCEGCGDCSVASNCVSIEPLETAFGRKRKINQHSCNKDFSCINGFCPSFVTVTGAKLRRAAPDHTALVAKIAVLPEPARPDLTEPYEILITGIGGTGVVTIGAILGMASHIEGYGVSVLDNAGMAQKNGAVTSHVRIAPAPGDLHITHIATGATDLLLACDSIVADSPVVMTTLTAGVTEAVVNSAIAPTAEFQSNNNMIFQDFAIQRQIRTACGEDKVEFVDATGIATTLLGDAIATNMFMLGYAYQRGRIPLSAAAIEQAIRLNGTAADLNKRAFATGRLAAHDPKAIKDAIRALGEIATETVPDDLDDMIALQSAHLTAYQNAAYAQRYRKLVAQAREAEADKTPGLQGFAYAVARYAAKLMSYKDEYEVARLYTDGKFLERLKTQFDGAFELTFHLAPPILARRDPHTKALKKQAFGTWMFAAFGVLAKLKGLRGTRLDPFGMTAERRNEKALIADYAALIAELCDTLSPQNHGIAVKLASSPDGIRGFGHIKEKNIAAARAEWAALLEKFHKAEATAIAAE